MRKDVLHMRVRNHCVNNYEMGYVVFRLRMIIANLVVISELAKMYLRWVLVRRDCNFAIPVARQKTSMDLYRVLCDIPWYRLEWAAPRCTMPGIMSPLYQRGAKRNRIPPYFRHPWPRLDHSALWRKEWSHHCHSTKHIQRLVPMVFKRCAIQINVESANWVWMVFWTLKSVSTSTLLVASSWFNMEAVG